MDLPEGFSDPTRSPPIQSPESLELDEQQQILRHLIKPQYTQQVLEHLRNQIILDRAYMKLNFSDDSLHEAIAASAYSLAQLHLVDKILEGGRVIDSNHA